MKNKFLHIIFFLLALNTYSFALPNKIKERPIVFDKPIKFDEINFSKEYKETLKNVPWIIFIERENQTTFKKPKKGFEGYKRVFFKQNFYVIDEKKEWIRIIKTSSRNLDGVKLLGAEVYDFGWIKKEDVLLWNKAIRHRNWSVCPIRLFPFSNNSERNLNISIYTSPKTEEYFEYKLEMGAFYYLIKEDPNSNRLLISTSPLVNQIGIKQNIVGWVEGSDNYIWKTCMSVIPNTYEMSIKERMKSRAQKMIGFGTLLSSIEQSNSSRIIEKDIVWDYDLQFKKKLFKRNKLLDYFPLLVDADYNKENKIIKTVGIVIDDNGNKQMVPFYLATQLEQNTYLNTKASIFITRDDFATHCSFLDRIVNIYELNKTKKAKELILGELEREIQNISGRDFSKKIFENMTNIIFVQIYTGSKSGLVEEQMKQEIPLGSLLSSQSKVDKVFDNWIHLINKKRIKLKEILNKGNDESMLNEISGISYFQIPVDDFF